MNWGTFKGKLTDALIDHLDPIQVVYRLFRLLLWFRELIHLVRLNSLNN